MTWHEQMRKWVGEGQWKALANLLNGLSNTDFRRAEKELKTEVLPALAAPAFWTAWQQLVAYSPQAFLSGILAAKTLMERGEWDTACPQAQAAAQALTQPQCVKVLRMLLPLMTQVDGAQAVFSLFPLDDEREQLAVLLRTPTDVSAFLTFQLLSQMPDGRTLAARTAQWLARQTTDHATSHTTSYATGRATPHATPQTADCTTDRAANLCAILCAAFSLTPPAGSGVWLKIEPYELDKLHTYAYFRHVLDGKKPKV